MSMRIKPNIRFLYIMIKKKEKKIIEKFIDSLIYNIKTQ